MTDKAAQTGNRPAALVTRFARPQLTYGPLRSRSDQHPRRGHSPDPTRRNEADAPVPEGVLQAMTDPIRKMVSGRMRIAQLQDTHRLAVRADDLLPHALREVSPTDVAIAFDQRVGLGQPECWRTQQR